MNQWQWELFPGWAQLYNNFVYLEHRSICEATLAETFREQRFVKDMEEEERMDRPWNAWIAARKESLQATNLPTTHEVSPDNCRRMTFEQWLSEKELQHLRSLFASAQEAANTNEKQAKLLKGKSFEEWVEDKRKDIEREREKEREVEDQQKEEQEKKDRRQKISRQKYEKWLMQKDLGALEEEEKLVQQAKQKLEIMKKKWEEEDQKKKDRRTVVGRTRSLPVETPLLNRHTRTK